MRKMKDEMEIMMEFLSKFNYAFRSDFPMQLMNEIKEWLPDAVRREIVRVLEEIEEKGLYAYHEIAGGEGKTVQGINLETFTEYIAKYSPKPKYCEFMAEMIRNGDVKIVGKHYEIKNTHRILLRCPVCAEGKNCIRGDR